MQQLKKLRFLTYTMLAFSLPLVVLAFARPVASQGYSPTNSGALVAPITTEPAAVATVQPVVSPVKSVTTSNVSSVTPTVSPSATESQPAITQEPSPVACTNSYPEQSCLYPELPDKPSAAPTLSPEPMPVACTNSYPEQSCIYDTTPINP